jgi:PAS domain S-box-containing protein
VLRSEVIGVLGAYRRTGDGSRSDDEEMLSALADQAAIALENARLYTDLRDEVQERRRAEAERERLLEGLRQMNERLVEANKREQDRAKEAEAARTEAERQTARLNALLAELNQGVTISDVRGHIVLRNQAARQITGLADKDLEEAIARREGVYLRLDGKPLPYEEWPVTRVLSGEHLTDYEVMVQHPDGKPRRLAFSGSMVGDQDDQRLVLAVYRDVTRLRELEAKELHRLTHREQEVAALVASGMTNEEIAQRLVVVLGTVSNHVAHILKKLGFSHRVQIATWAIQCGLWPPMVNPG